ncbi:molybdopterin-dependent oxidoreductase, partial [Clostridioides difficile]|uniref:molybdopterin-dependent oxidoreductase n=1 Tax=Clostridioides difficile TaxID=1496 RepID=UPI003F69A9E5
MNKTELTADVILPATRLGEQEVVDKCEDRGFQLMRKAIETQEDVKPDWQIISEISTARGYPMNYKNTKEIWDELRQVCQSFLGATYEKIETQGSVKWTCKSERMEYKGTMYLYEGEKISNQNGNRNLYAEEWSTRM